MAGKFAGKVIIVTGGASGIGKAVADSFVREDGMVIVIDIKIKNRRSGFFIGADLADTKECERATAESFKQFGRINILVNNAGIQPPESYQTVAELNEHNWDRILDVNLKSYAFMAKYTIPHLVSSRGAIVNIASVQGMQSMPRVAAYGASKAGVLSLTRTLALELAGSVRVNSVSPGTVRTPMIEAAASMESEDLESAISSWGKRHPLGRVGQPREIAQAVLFLASEDASFITGANLVVDGGLMAVGSWYSF